VVGSCDGDRVHILLFQNFAEVLLRHRRFAHFLRRTVREFLKNIAVHVAHIRDARRAFVGLQRRKMRVTAPIQADHRKVQPIVGPEDLRITLGRGSHRQAGRANNERIEKSASCNHHFPFGRRTWPALGPARRIAQRAAFWLNFLPRLDIPNPAGTPARGARFCRRRMARLWHPISSGYARSLAERWRFLETASGMC